MSNYRKKLEERKKQVLEQLESIKESAKPVDLTDPIGRLSRMDAIQHQQMALNSKKQLENALELIEQAFRRIERDEYGYCLKCEEEMSEKRLLARPEAPFCTRCQG